MSRLVEITKVGNDYSVDVNATRDEIELNKSITIDVSQYSEPIEITPTSGNDAMAKVTITLTNIGNSK